MSYYPDTNTYQEVMEADFEKVDPRRIVGGIGLYRIDPVRAAEQVSLVRRLGLLGYCFFSYTTFWEDPSLAGKLSSLVTPSGSGLPPEFRPYVRNVYE